MSVGCPGTPGSYSHAADLLRALASPVRIAIVMQLDAGALFVHELVDAHSARSEDATGIHPADEETPLSSST